MEIWYTMAGDVEKRAAQDALQWINEQLYSRPIDRLRFLISSTGGDIGAGIGLHTYLKALPIEVQTIGFGHVDAAASLVFLGGKRRLALDGCQFFFHEGRYTIADPTGPIHAHEEAISVFRRELHEMIYTIARECGTDTELVANMLRKSKIMTADEAQEFGMCHEIIKELPLSQQEERGVGFVERKKS